MGQSPRTAAANGQRQPECIKQTVCDSDGSLEKNQLFGTLDGLGVDSRYQTPNFYVVEFSFALADYDIGFVLFLM